MAPAEGKAGTGGGPDGQGDELRTPGSGSGPGTKSGGEVQRGVGPGGAPQARSGEEQGEEGLLEGDAGQAEEEWEEDRCLVGPCRAREEEVVGEGVVAEEECWS
ncbi:hypothetical protein GOODEAATRI_013333 [Goodea atripinnis]|uniref:Uncharacterized protein n=1 Tax=Goodea atripinnis TaxID=208336 RepID=A0ABV0PDP8_9TELE